MSHEISTVSGTRMVSNLSDTGAHSFANTLDFIALLSTKRRLNATDRIDENHYSAKGRKMELHYDCKERYGEKTKQSLTKFNEAKNRMTLRKHIVKQCFTLANVQEMQKLIQSTQNKLPLEGTITSPTALIKQINFFLLSNSSGERL